MKKSLKLAAMSAAMCAAFSGNANAAGDTIKIGFITDMSGTYADFDGQGGVEAIKTAHLDSRRGALFLCRAARQVGV